MRRLTVHRTGAGGIEQYTIGQVEGQIVRVLAQGAARAVAAGALPAEAAEQPVAIEVPRDRSHGDYASNLAMTLARPARRNPREIASILVDHMDTAGTFIKEVTIAGPGFINFTLDPAWLHGVVDDVFRLGDQYGRVTLGQGQRVLVEFVSANPTGPLNVVSARHAALGDALASLLTAAGYQTHREYYVNDAGNQIQTLGLALDIRLRQLQGEDVELPEGAYPGEYLIDLARRVLAGEPGAPPVDQLPADDEARREILARYAVAHFVAEHREMLARYGVQFDRWFHESEVRESGGAEEVIRRLQAAGHVYQQDGALWLRTTDFGDDKDRVLMKNDGSYTYLLPDVAYHVNKLERGFDLLIDILGRDHFGYHVRLEAALAALGWDPKVLEVLYLQMVHLVRGQETVRMSKRQGRYVTMAEFLDEVSVDAARYFFLMRSADTEIDFDLDLANLQSNDNPVYYVQYAHARMAGILRQAREQGVALPGRLDSLAEVKDKAGADLWSHPAEQDLLRLLAALPGEIADAARTRAPHHLTRYAHDLATNFHQFYTQCRVLGAEEHLAGSRLALVQATQVVLQRVLGLLGVSAPERM